MFIRNLHEEPSRWYAEVFNALDLWHSSNSERQMIKEAAQGRRIGRDRGKLLATGSLKYYTRYACLSLLKRPNREENRAHYCNRFDDSTRWTVLIRWSAPWRRAGTCRDSTSALFPSQMSARTACRSDDHCAASWVVAVGFLPRERDRTFTFASVLEGVQGPGAVT